MSSFSWKEFRPTIRFLAKFIVMYLVGNILYGLFVTSFMPKPDPVTNFVSTHTGFVLTACGWPVEIVDHKTKPNTLVVYNNSPVLSVYEGCNGVNTIIIFISFLIAFGPLTKKLLWFIPLGVVLIHLTNLARITLLFYVARYQPDYMYFTHKYLFTAILYAVIFLLWVWWVNKFARVEAK